MESQGVLKNDIVEKRENFEDLNIWPQRRKERKIFDKQISRRGKCLFSGGV